MNTIDHVTAREIHAILRQQCGDQLLFEDEFIAACEIGVTEYRFMGSLGFGGKFYNERYNRVPWRVSCYSEDRTDARDAAINTANEKLAELWKSKQPTRKGT